MQAQAVRRLLPQGANTSFLAALSPKTGFNGSVPAATSNSALHIAAISEERQQQQEQPSTLSMKPAFASIMPTIGFAASPLLAGSRQLSTMSGMRKPSLPLKAGMGNGSALDARVANAVRSYYTEGELFGTAYLYTTNIMFWAGIMGAVAFRRNLIVMLLSAEVVMLACNMNFLFASAYLNDITGVIMSITITTIAACETAIGLALCVAYFHMRSATDVEALNLLK